MAPVRWGGYVQPIDLRSARLHAGGIGRQIIVLLIGVPLGAIAGYYGGKVDLYLMRFVDVMYAFPTFLCHSHHVGTRSRHGEYLYRAWTDRLGYTLG
ncbi:MAG: hypothetical protein R2867_33945 [Caldilineaceae bacterium]